MNLPNIQQFELFERYANVIARSSWNKSNHKTQDILMIILYGYGLGFDPVTSIQQIHIVNGKPSISVQGMIALANISGKLSMLDIPDQLDVIKTKSATVKAKRIDRDDVYTFTFTLDDAKKAGIANSQTWQKYEGQMLLSRATSGCLRRALPDAIAGLHTTEELADGNIELDKDGIPVVSSEIILTDTQEPQKEENQPPTPQHWTQQPEKFLKFVKETFGLDTPKVVYALDQAYGIPGTSEIKVMTDYTGDKDHAMAACICEFAKWDRMLLAGAVDTYAGAKGIKPEMIDTVRPIIGDIMSSGATQQELIPDDSNPLNSYDDVVF